VVHVSTGEQPAGDAQSGPQRISNAMIRLYKDQLGRTDKRPHALGRTGRGRRVP